MCVSGRTYCFLRDGCLVLLPILQRYCKGMLMVDHIGGGCILNGDVCSCYLINPNTIVIVVTLHLFSNKKM